MQIVFRRYRPGDEVGIVELLKQCFTTFNMWNITVDDWLYFEKNDYGFKKENALIAEHDGKIVGHVHVVYRRIRIGTAYIDVGGIANVSTHPDYRGRGIATKLMSMAIELCREKGWPLSSLLTGYASAGYRVYRSLGYTDTFFLYEYRGTRESVERSLEKLKKFDVEVDELREEYLEDVVKLYEEWSRHLNASVWRPIDYWRERILLKTFYYSYFYDVKEAGIRIVAKRNGSIVGYALAVLGNKTTRSYWSRDTGVLLEVVGTDSYILRALLRKVFESMLKEGLKVFRLFIPFNENYSDILKNFVECRGAIYMDYIVDQTKLFESLRSELELRIRNSYLHEVEKTIDIVSPFGCTELIIENDRVSIGSECRSSERVVMSRDAIARLIYGVQSFKDVLFDGGVEYLSIDSKGLEVLNTLFPKRTAYTPLIDQW